jgi:hypothetical protein
MQDMLASLIATGRVTDIVLAVMAIEGVILAVVFRTVRSELIGLAGNLVGGAALVLALRFALTGSDWHWIAGALLLSMAGHLVDLVVRMRCRWGEPPATQPKG